MGKEERTRLILEYLAENEVALPPKVLHENLVIFKGATFSYDTVRRRLSDLEERGLIQFLDKGNGYYRITEEGESFLDGDLDAGEISDPSEE